MTAILLMASVLGGFGCRSSSDDPVATSEPDEALHRSIDEQVQQLSLDVLEQRIRELATEPHDKEEEHVLKSALLLRTADYVGSLSEIAKINPNGLHRETALWVAGESLFHRGDIATAMPLLSTLVAEFPGHLRGHRCLASLYFDMGAMDEAQVHLEKVIELEPTDHRPHYLLGEMYRDYEHFKKSIDQYKRSLELSSGSSVPVEIERGLAEAYCADRNYADLLAWEPEHADDVTIRVCRAEALWSTGRREESRRLVQRALEVDPDDGRALLLSARLDLDGGRIENAITQFNRILNIDPHNVAARFQLAQTYRRAGNEELFEVHMSKCDASRTLIQQLVDLNKQALVRVGDLTLYDEIIDVCDRLGKDKLAERWRTTAAGLRKRGP